MKVDEEFYKKYIAELEEEVKRSHDYATFTTTCLVIIGIAAVVGLLIR